MDLKLVPTVYANDCVAGPDGVIFLGNCLMLNEEQAVKDVYQTPADLVNLIVPNLFVVSGVILFMFILYAGFLFIQGSTKGKEQAGTIMSTALVGFLIMFVAYWIVQIVEIVIGMQILP